MAPNGIILELDEKPTEREDKLVRKIRDSKLPPARRGLARYRAEIARRILEFAARLVCPLCEGGYGVIWQEYLPLHKTQAGARTCDAYKIWQAIHAHDAAIKEREDADPGATTPSTGSEDE